MADLEGTLSALAMAATWDARVALIRKIPEAFGTAQHAAMYSAIARQVYVPRLAPDFAYVNWREEYELPSLEAAYRKAYEITAGFTRVSAEHLAQSIRREPTTLRVFRLFLGLLPQEFAASSNLIAGSGNLPAVTSARVKSIEAGSRPSETIAQCCAEVIVRVMEGRLFPALPGPSRRKIEKPDTLMGWRSVQGYAEHGVPLPVFLHQRHYGGSFRQLLDATSGIRGDLLEQAVEDLFIRSGIQYLRTGSANQRDIEARFGVTIKPAPDFVVFDQGGTLRAVLECKAVNDGGTARDKAARYRSLRQECIRLGGTPLFAVLSGLGWTRTADALGPVVRDTDGRVFMLANLAEMLAVQPFPEFVRA